MNLGFNFSGWQARVPAQYQPYVPYAMPIIAATLGLVMAVAFLLPNVNELISLKSQADDDAARASNLDAKAKKLQGLDQSKLNAELVNTTGAIPSDKDVAGFLSEFSTIAANAGATIDTAQLSPQSAVTKEKNALDFQVIIKGNFATIKGFLTKIETARKVMIVKSISINVSEDKKLSADLTITGYYEPLATLSASLDDPLPERTDIQEKLLVDLQKRTIYAPPVSTTPSVSGRSDPFSGF